MRNNISFSMFAVSANDGEFSKQISRKSHLQASDCFQNNRMAWANVVACTCAKPFRVFSLIDRRHCAQPVELQVYNQLKDYAFKSSSQFFEMQPSLCMNTWFWLTLINGAHVSKEKGLYQNEENSDKLRSIFLHRQINDNLFQQQKSFCVCC